VAEALVIALRDRADVTALDWGTQAADAAALGVHLHPKCDHIAYLNLLAGADVVVGQTAGIIAASEIEAIATGAPVVLPVPLPLYAEEPPPVLGGSVADTVTAVEALLDGSQPHDPDAGRTWTRDHHGVEHAVDTVADVHRAVVEARR